MPRWRWPGTSGRCRRPPKAGCGAWTPAPWATPPGGLARAGPARRTRSARPRACCAWPSRATGCRRGSRCSSCVPTTNPGSPRAWPPSHDVDEVAVWLQRGANRGHLNLYLDAFQHTLAVMQTRDALIRVAAECAEDLAADGVVYAEVRFAPELHVTCGLSLDQVVEAVLEGFRRGSAGRGITVYALLTAMRTAARSLEIAELAVRHRDEGVVGFDIAGAEAGWPPSRHLDAFQYVARENFHITIHAGEGFGLPSIWEALQWCGAERLGHGVRIVDDIEITPAGMATLGRLASYVRDRRIPL